MRPFSSKILIKMKCPKNKMTAFIRLSEKNHPQVNLHKGVVYNYWFIEPSEKPIKLRKGQIPDLLKNADLGDLGSF
jgi:hypothetical protein